MNGYNQDQVDALQKDDTFGYWSQHYITKLDIVTKEGVQQTIIFPFKDTNDGYDLVTNQKVDSSIWKKYI